MRKAAEDLCRWCQRKIHPCGCNTCTRNGWKHYANGSHYCFPGSRASKMAEPKEYIKP